MHRARLTRRLPTGRRSPAAALAFLLGIAAPAQIPQLTNRDGLQISVDDGDRNPAIHVRVPGGPPAERSFNILLPEHVTVLPHGQTEVTHLYIFKPGAQGEAPHWKTGDHSLEYTKELSGIHFSARATIQSDGILFHYEFTNHSETDYDMVWAVTDPRFRTFFYDPRLERTYVHHTQGFDLLASETPERLTMPLSQWLPVRYLAQLTAPIPEQRVQHRDDGIAYYYKSRAVDLPLIATLSADRKWVAASFARNPGNVWSNPELTCQHVDPQVSLLKGQTAFYEVKIVIFQGTLEDALAKARQELPGLLESSPRR